VSGATSAEAAPHERAAGALAGGTGQPEQIAEAVIWLCSEAAARVTGHVMVVDAGATITAR
jgi:NAD(P)-dependent dehydrogenase (short-subunit alcohol dehydrogenase family)